ncbi:cellobiohydrolase I-I [Pluteus cervinus]|uniref:Cellobiohydrolase I-I n=1 Tax=Pluteus cervinus TaxID=181527 RepID=A0ACD3A4K1_9AGAR|nr:cellobiohydrolase I-I [Pluteus cervinus]
MFPKSSLLIFATLAAVRGQQVGTVTAETHPSLSWSRCSAGGSCQTVQGSVVLDSNWRWLHTTTGYTNCYNGNSWDKTLCPDGATCAANCAVDGADYPGTYGITTTGNSLTLKFVTTGENKNIGSRVYLMANETSYEMFKLLNQEFTFDVDLSKLPCGLNGALYFSEMEVDGGLSKHPGNKAGAKYGTGYCDSQCPRDIKFINGEANVAGWGGSPNDTNAGTGSWGACCNEMDIWEANSAAAAYTPHPCSVSGISRCEGPACSGADRYATVCDPDGCDFNSYRMGDPSFYGPGKTVDTNSKFTVITQFLTNNNSTTGTLSEIRRLYVQNGKVIQNSKVNVPGLDSVDSITGAYCDSQKTLFGDTKDFQNKGGLAAMGKGLGNGMVLVMSVWDDHAANMLWLDSTYPVEADASAPGVARGTCATSTGKPEEIEQSAADATVTYSNIRVGPIGSTYNSGGAVPPPPPVTTTPGTPPSSTVPAPAATQTKYGQCGGTGWTGPTQCAAGSTCNGVSAPWYYQCL